MIIYIFNNYFLDESGFSKRCKKEIDILSKIDDIQLICRKSNIDNQIYINKYREIKINYFNLSTKLLETPSEYKTVFYEIYRTIRMFQSLSIVLLKSIWKNKKKNLKIYIVNSPITLSLFCLIFARIFGVSKTIIEFHDLEPEMAINIKNLNENSFVLKVEYFLEKYLCSNFSKIIVTNKIQAKILENRTKIKENKIFVLPNTLNKLIIKNYSKKLLLPIGIKKNDFVIGYISTLTFDYTFKGLIEFIKYATDFLNKNFDIKVVVIGGGDGLSRVKNIINKLHLNKSIILTGKIKHAEYIMSRLDLCVIPWEENDFTKTIVPTKLFEYLAYKKTVIVPDFKSFKEVIINNLNGLTYSSVNDLIKKIQYLKFNKTQREVLAENGYKDFINKFSLEHYKKNYLNFINL